MSEKPIRKDELAYRLLRLIRPLHLGVQRRLDRAQSARDLSPSMRDVLDLAREAGPERSTVPFLATLLALDRQPVQSAVDRLLERKLLVRVPNPAHRRSPLLEVTARGEAALDAIRAEELSLLHPMVDPFSSGELDTCLKVLRHLQIELLAKKE